MAKYTYSIVERKFKDKSKYFAQAFPEHNNNAMGVVYFGDLGSNFIGNTIDGYGTSKEATKAIERHQYENNYEDKVIPYPFQLPSDAEQE